MHFLVTEARKHFIWKTFFLNFYSSIAIMDMLECKFIATQWYKWSKIDLVINEQIAVMIDTFAPGLCFIKYVCCFVLFGFVLFYFSTMFCLKLMCLISCILVIATWPFLVFVVGLFIQSSVQEQVKGNKK